MNPLLPSTSAPSPPMVMDGTDVPSLVSPSTSTDSAWSMESDPQVFAPDAAFWHDMSSYICASPQSPYDYSPSDPSGIPEDAVFKVPAPGSRRVRSKEQSPEVLLRRRAQNRASQRAYRDRKDRRVKELEAQLEEMSETNESLQRTNDTFSATMQELKDELAKLKSVAASASAAAHSTLAASTPATAQAKNNDESSQQRSESRWSSLASLGLQVQGEGEGEEVGKGIVVKVMICKRCFGAAAVPSGNAEVTTVCDD